MKAYYIDQYTVKKLWGYKTYSIQLHEDVNVIIGPNASGKTTLINILYDALTANFSRLFRTEFSEVSITLKAFEGNGTETVSVDRGDEGVRITIGKKAFRVPGKAFPPFPEAAVMRNVPSAVLAAHFGLDIRDVQTPLRGLVPAVWLPVSRRLPIAEEEEAASRSLHRKPLESVDECLAELVEKLQQYRLALNSDLAELRKDFQRHALENILYDKQHDQWTGRSRPRVPPSDNDKLQLLQAFRDVGLVDARMEKRIDEHFSAARESITKFTNSKGEIDINAILILPLLARTQAMVEFAQELETKRGALFEPLQQYEKIVNDFLNDKRISVSDRGELIITPDRKGQGQLKWRHLSSGEKQILILLTQALVSGRSPVVYVADEPELSLHVTWQEKLLSSLTKLAGRCQFIVATHSPDIAAGFGEKVIDLARH